MMDSPRSTYAVSRLAALVAVVVAGAGAGAGAGGCFEDLTVVWHLSCGDGVLDAGEECDDANETDGDGCSAACLLELSDEVCDDENDNDGDGLVDCEDPDCDADVACDPECGDGLVEEDEECDDGNATDGDGCSAACLLEASPEVCDDGLDNDGDGLVDCGDPDCTADSWCNPVCGNGTLEWGEDCDDGNTEDRDGCSTTCMLD